MFEFSSATIKNLAVHLIGNRSKDEELRLSNKNTLIADEVTEQYIKEYFFSSFNFDLSYQFAHESDVNLNELYVYATSIFQSHDSLIEQSINIAKHLYEVSTHPNIKKGELYVAYIENCEIDGIKTNTIGIFKSETKDFYLNVKPGQNTFNINYKKGVNTKKLDKGCLIFDYGQMRPQRIFIVDTNHNDALYWKNNFLKVEELQDEYTNTTKILNTCRKFIRENPDLEKTSKISFLNNSVQYFESHDKFAFDNFTDFACEDKNHYKAFKSYIEENDLSDNFNNSFEISKKAVSVVKKKIKNFIKLDSDIEIKIPSKISSVEQIIEQGYDTKKQMKYYKIYYTNEK